jgi:osmoprotectant transport system substrate-binding protein
MSSRTSFRRSLAVLLSVGTLFFATACADDDPDNEDAQDDSTPSETSEATESAPTDQGELTIASQSFPEAALVAAMYEQLLTEAGYTVDVKLVDTRDAYMADFPDNVDVVPEYVGGIVNFLNSRANGDDAVPFEAGDGEQLAADGKALLDEAGMTLLDLSEAADANAFMVTEVYSTENGVTKLSDLEGESVKLAAAPDCEGRLDCEGGLTEEYGIDITEVLPLGFASPDTYQAVLDGEVELGLTSTTDGTLESQGLLVLEDDKQIQPAQNLVPAVSTEFLDEHPDVADVLNPLMAALDTGTLTTLNAQMAVDRMKAEDVAADFLSQAGLTS